MSILYNKFPNRWYGQQMNTQWRTIKTRRFVSEARFSSLREVYRVSVCIPSGSSSPRPVHRFQSCQRRTTRPSVCAFINQWLTHVKFIQTDTKYPEHDKLVQLPRRLGYQSYINSEYIMTMSGDCLSVSIHELLLRMRHRWSDTEVAK